jgi:cytochrome c oxidase subunit 3
VTGWNSVRPAEGPGRDRPSRGPLSPLLEEAQRTAAVGMLFALGSWTMLFASFIFAGAALRLHASGWPPPGTPRLPVALAALAAALLLASGLLLRTALGGRTAERRVGGLLGTLALGGLFLTLQATVWLRLWRAGFRLSSSVAGSLFYTLTALHALHVAAGLLALAALLPHARRTADGGYGRVTALYWNFMAAVGLVVFLAVYVA